MRIFFQKFHYIFIFALTPVLYFIREDEFDDNGGNEEEEKEADPLVANIPVNLRPHGQVWADEGEILVDPTVNNGQYNLPIRINWGSIAQLQDQTQMDPIQYFYLLFPMSFLRERCLVLTNLNLERVHKASTTIGEILRFFGITFDQDQKKATWGWR